MIKIIEKSIDELVPYENNARINDKAVDIVANSIREFGFRNPCIIDKNNVIVAGHTRVLACKKLGIDKVPCIVADDLTEEQIKAFRIADNSSAQIAEWDIDKLMKELDTIDYDMEQFGLAEQLAEIEKTIEKENQAEEDDYVEPDDLETRVNLGEVWQLGRHRLMCGDSTKEEDVAKLMDGNNVDMIFTDPPYNINYSGVKDKRTIKNDKMENEEFVDFLVKSLIKTSTAYVCCSWQYCDLFKKAMEIKEMKPKAMIIWNKINPAQNLDKYFKQHEIIWYYGKFGGEKTIRGDIWECKRQKNNLHPTMKPIELISMAIKDNPLAKNIYDAFGGSGSTLIACEQLNRKCYMMELDEHYATVIVDRWEKLTGQKAEKIN